MTFRLPPVYPITDKLLAGKPSHVTIVRELIRGGATLIQIRDKSTPLDELLADLNRCVEYAARFEARIIVNDRCDLALLSDADGVHLGQDDLPPDAARRVVGPRKILGFSTHTSAQVRAAMPLPVQYIGFGPVFVTSTKLNPAHVTGLEGLRRACRLSKQPVVAIGGIGPEQIRSVLEAGAASAAVVSALMRSEKIARTMERLLAIGASVCR